MTEVLLGVPPCPQTHCSSFRRRLVLRGTAPRRGELGRKESQVHPTLLAPLPRSASLSQGRQPGIPQPVSQLTPKSPPLSASLQTGLSSCPNPAGVPHCVSSCRRATSPEPPAKALAPLGEAHLRPPYTPRVQASRRPRVALGPTRGAALQGLLQDHWSSGSWGRGWDRAAEAELRGRGHTRGAWLAARAAARFRAETGGAPREGGSARRGGGGGPAERGLWWAPLSVGGPGGFRGVHLGSWGSGGTRRPPSGRARRRYWTSGTPGR